MLPQNMWKQTTKERYYKRWEPVILLVLWDADLQTCKDNVQEHLEQSFKLLEKKFCKWCLVSLENWIKGKGDILAFRLFPSTQKYNMEKSGVYIPHEILLCLANWILHQRKLLLIFRPCADQNFHYFIIFH